MTTHVPLNCGQYFYVGKVYVEEEKNHVDFIYQFVKKSCAYNRPNSYIDNLLHNVIGNTKFRNYFPRLYWITYNVDISVPPLKDQIKTLLDYTEIDIKGPCNKNFSQTDMFEIEFPKAVYPIRISIYEYPHDIIEIWAQDFDNHQWYLLWDQLAPVDSIVEYLTFYKNCSFYKNPILFSPPLKWYNFKTKKLGIRTITRSADIGAIILIGTSKMILPRNPEENLSNLLNSINCMYNYQDDICNLTNLDDICNLTNNEKNAHLDVVHLQENLFEYCIISESCSNLPSDDLDESRCSSDFPISDLPVEIILKILENLDLSSLGRMSQVNKFFNKLTSQSYKRLNVRNMKSYKAFDDIKDVFRYFTPRCRYLQQLDLTSSNFYITDFISFLNHCGKHLTHLRLSNCQKMNNFALLNISKICKKLKELTLSNCRRINNKGFLYLKNLNNLEHLNLCGTRIETQSLCEILKNNRQMRALNLKLLRINIDPIAIELKNSCQDLEILNLQFADNITSQGADALADCKNLRRVNLIRMYDRIYNNDLYKLLSSWQYLEEIHLSRFYFDDRYLELIIQCQNLEQLYIHEVKLLTFRECFVICDRCPKLKKLYFIACYELWLELEPFKKIFPHVRIDFLHFKDYKKLLH